MLFRFRSFPVYIRAKEFRVYVKKLLKDFPSDERYCLVDQINRAATSICLNIAEGSNRASDRDKAHFLNQALTSLEEVISAFDLSLDDHFITQKSMDNLLTIGEDLGKQLIGFSKSLLHP
jgi:four helix bundle protein